MAEKYGNKNEKLITRIKERYKAMHEADQENRQMAMQDMKFMNVPGEQWDPNMKIERGDRPCYEFNKLRVTGKRIINDMRISRPQGKVRGFEDGDKELADIYEGLIRNIWNMSDGDTVIDYAAEYQVSAGMGAWRITTDYVDDDVFDQDIRIEPINNPFCLFADEASRDILKRDARDWIVTERISKESYEAKWPKKDAVDFESSEFDDDWKSEDSVRICEYWYKEPVTREIWQLEDGRVISSDDEGASGLEGQIKNRRTVKTNKIMMCIASGEAILEGPTEWAGRIFPFVPIYGEYMIIDGKTYWWGLPRFAKDAQRSYNFSRTAIAETIAQAPQNKFWATAKQAEGHVEKWAVAHQQNFPFLLFNPDPQSPGPPMRMGGADIPVALIQETQIASEELKAVTGIFSPDLGAGGQAKSGLQERERRAQGQVATFNYQDNLNKGIRLTWEILVDLIPHIYDTERELRVLGSDGMEQYKKINQDITDEMGNQIKVNDLSIGRYDVTITTGPSFTTQRQEAAEVYMSMAQTNPNIFGVAGDLIFKALDLPYSEDIAERLRSLLPPEIQQTIGEDGAMSPEVQAAMQQAQQAMAMVQQQAQMIEQAAQELQMEKSDVDQSKAELEKMMANLKAEEAKFEAKIAKEVADLTKKDAELQVREIGQEVVKSLQERQQDRLELSNEFNNAVDMINQHSMDFMSRAAEMMKELKQNGVHKQPKILRIKSERVKGQLHAIPVYEESEVIPDIESEQEDMSQDLPMGS